MGLSDFVKNRHTDVYVRIRFKVNLITTPYFQTLIPSLSNYRDLSGKNKKHIVFKRHTPRFIPHIRYTAQPVLPALYTEQRPRVYLALKFLENQLVFVETDRGRGVIVFGRSVKVYYI